MGVDGRAVAQNVPRGNGIDRLFRLSPALLCIAGTDGYFKRVNPAFEKTLGHTDEEWLSRPFIDFVHPDDRDATLNELQKLSTGLPAVHFENRYRHANGSYRWLLWNSTPVPEEGLLYASALDITDRKRADELFRDLLHAAPDSIIIIDREGKILRVNHATETFFGYRSSELTGESIECLVAPAFRDRYREHLSACTRDPASRRCGEDFDLVGVRMDGSEFPAAAKLGPAESQGGRIVICAVRDMSLRRQREQQLQTLTARLVLAEEEERRRIARGLHDDVGHSLLTAKMSIGELLETDTPCKTCSPAQQLHGLLDRAIGSVRALSFELASPVLYEVGLGAALQSICESAQARSGIRFDVHADLNHDPIPQDKQVILYRVGRELVRNVVRHSRAQIAKLSLTLSENRVRMTVEDDGHGFDATQARCHDPNVGFGLFSITQQLDPIGGTLKLESSPDSGTRAVVAVSLDDYGEAS